MKSVLLLIAIISCSPSFSAGMGNNAQKEIFHLFDYLQKSNCEFNRNGSWYSPQEAVKHLERKYHWLVRKGLMPFCIGYSSVHTEIMIPAEPECSLPCPIKAYASTFRPYGGK